MMSRVIVIAALFQGALALNLGMSPMARLAAAKNVTVERDSCAFGTCGGGGGPISSATKAQVASILEGILGSLQKGSLLSSKSTLNNASRPAKQGATDKPVKEALQSLLSTMRSTSEHKEAKVVVAKMLAREVPEMGDASCTYFQVCSEEERPIDSQTKAEVANILEGIIKNL